LVILVELAGAETDGVAGDVADGPDEADTDSLMLS
jgi:hypothetical protein